MGKNTNEHTITGNCFFTAAGLFYFVFKARANKLSKTSLTPIQPWQMEFTAEPSPDDLYQVAMLIDQLKHDDTQMRINASKELVRVAKALGPDRTRSDLIPFLSESTDDEDDVLCVIADKLGDLVDYVGGSQFAHILLGPLESLTTVEDAATRDMAVKSTEIVTSKMSDSDITEFFVPFLNKLVANDWFTSRISAAALMHIAYKRVQSPTTRNTIRQHFLRLCSDDTPMVRRVAAQYLSKHAVIPVAGKPGGDNSEILHAFSQIASDDQDSVRILVIANCIELGKILPMDVKVSHIFPVVRKIAADKSWRVRWSLASKMDEVAGCFSSTTPDHYLNEKEIINSVRELFENLLVDTEAEVRTAAASNFSAVCSLIDKAAVASRMLDCASRLAQDSSEHVRGALGAVINDVAQIIGRHNTVELLLPILLILLRDTCPDVRLNVISNLETINTVIGIELLSQSLLPAIVNLAEDPNWRIRMSIMEQVPSLSKQLGQAFFNEKLNYQCVSWLCDSVYAVRRAAATNVQNLTALWGGAWALEHAIPQLIKLGSAKNYLHRVNVLYAMELIATTLSVDAVETSLLPTVATLAQDIVPNVRLNAAKSLQRFYWDRKVKDERSRTEIANLLQVLTDDVDRDVRAHAEAALTSASPSSGKTAASAH